jgi:hypothetical protein
MFSRVLRDPRARACGLILLLLLSARGAEAAISHDPGLVYGEGFSYLLAPPRGWVLDTDAGASDGLVAVFYPEGQSWARASAVMYVSSSKHGVDRTLAGYMAEEAQQYREKAGERARIREAPALTLASRGSAPVRLFSGDPRGSQDAVAYLEAPGSFVLIALNAHGPSEFDAALPAFRALVASWQLIGEGRKEVFAAALASAKQNQESARGARYQSEVASRFAGSVAALPPCANDAAGGAPGAFDLVARLGRDGSVEDAQVMPETPLTRCLRDRFRTMRFSAPPEPGWWVQFHLQIGP